MRVGVERLGRCGLLLGLALLAGCDRGTPEAAGGPPAAALTRLTHTSARNVQPFFSPDGAWISFVSNRSGSWQVWLMRPDGSEARQITRRADPVGWPSWSIDGSAILYYARTAEGQRLFEIALAGGEPRRLLDDGAESFRPLLSPRGDRLLFDRYGDGEPPNHDLFVLDLGSRALRRLTDDPGYDSDARWSPDGRRVVFHSDRDGEETFDTDIYLLTLGDGEVVRLTSGPSRCAYPVWSPDGERIAYTEESDGDRDLWIMDLAGRDRRRLTRHPGFDGDPAWAPDGRSIVFSSDRYGGSQELVRLELRALAE